MDSNIKNSPLWPDIKKVMESTNGLPRMIEHIKIHTENEDISVVKYVGNQTVRDYVGATTDYILAEVYMGLGDYALKLYPFRNNLQASIRYSDVRSDKEPSYVDEGDETEIRKFKAVFLTENPTVAEELAAKDYNTLQNSQIVKVRFQLLELAAVPIMMSRIYGNHNELDPETAIRTVLTKGTANIEIDGKPCIDSIDIYKPNNSDKKKNIIVKDGTHLIEFPKYLQETLCGVYSTGLGSYFQYYDKGLRWFVYPLFDIDRFNNEKNKRLIIYDIPKNNYEGMNRTYSVDGDIVSILITSGLKYKDNSGNNEINDGAGFKMLDARAVMRKPVEIMPDGKVAGSRARANHEVMVEERKDGLNYTTMMPSSGNSFKMFSQVNLRKKAELVVQWQYADNRVIYPGMPFKYVYYDGESVGEATGIVVAVDESNVSSTPDYKDAVFSTTINLRLFIKPIDKYKDSVPTNETFGSF